MCLFFLQMNTFHRTKYQKNMVCEMANSLEISANTSNLYRNCNKFYCNLTFYKLNTYLILTSACLVLWSKNVSTDKNFLRNILVTRGDPFVCACPRMRRTHCRQAIVERSSLYFWSPENKLCGEVGWVYPCEDKVSI